MATVKQAVEIVDDVLRLPAPTARWHAQRLQAAGVLPTSPGFPAQMAAADIAVLVCSVLVGSSLAADFAALRPGSGGPTLAAVLGSFLERSRDLIELTLDRGRTEAAITFAGDDGVINRISFRSDAQGLAPAYDSTVRIAGDVIHRLRNALAAAPEVRAGRPTARRKIRIHQ